MKTYNFRIVIEADGDRWHAYCPALVNQGAATWGNTREEALQHIQEVVPMVVDSLLEHGDPIPEEPPSDVRIFPEPQVAVVV